MYRYLFVLSLVYAQLCAVYGDNIFTDWIRMMTPAQYKSTNELFYSVLGRTSAITRNVNVPAKLIKRQIPIDKEVPFPCDVTNARSPIRPSSVHRLRPGDIDVVGAMGDSLTAGFGAIGVDILSVYIGNRGVSYAIGGQDTWRTMLTLPNILKEFNPRLVGYSYGDGLAWSQAAQFNAAEGMAISADMPHQAMLLIKRMRSDKRVDVEKDWKMITINIGSNDFCSWMCFGDTVKFLRDHESHMTETLDLLKNNLPRLLVNIVPAANLGRVIAKQNAKSEACVMFNSVECACLFGLKYKDQRKKQDQVMAEWQKFDLQIGSNPRYQDKPDFAVVVQPFTAEIEFPTKVTSSGRIVTDYTFLSPDCFHFSQKCHAISANALWNNMLEPVGNKTKNWEPRLMHRFLCPTSDRPYIYTNANS